MCISHQFDVVAAIFLTQAYLDSLTPTITKLMHSMTPSLSWQRTPATDRREQLYTKHTCPQDCLRRYNNKQVNKVLRGENNARPLADLGVGIDRRVKPANQKFVVFRCVVVCNRFCHCAMKNGDKTADFMMQRCIQGVGPATGDRGFKPQPLQCRVQPRTSCSHTLSSASEVTTLWRYINQFKYKKYIMREK